MSVLLRACLLLFGLAASVPALSGPRGDLCAAPEDTAGVVSALPHVAAVLKPGSRLDVLGIGSATMFGPEASLAPGTLTSQALGNGPALTPAAPRPITREPSEKAFPRQMALALQAAIPGLEVRVTVRGGRGLSAPDMVALLKSELAAHPFQLVLWQTGTVEAVRNVPPGEFAQTLAEGAEAVQAGQADLVLVDPQFSRFLQTNSNMEPYEQVLQQAAAMPGVLLFHRFDLMRSWANDGQIDLERTPRSGRQKAVETLHACLGAQLARLILAAAKS